MNNERKTFRNSFMKKASFPLILPPPKVVGYQQKFIKNEEEPDCIEENEEETALNKDEAKKECFYYQPKNPAGSFFYIETTDEEEDDSLEESVQEEDSMEQNLAETELPHEPSVMEEKAFTAGESYSEKLSGSDLQEETEFALNDEDLQEETDDIKEDVQEDFMMQELEEKTFSPWGSYDGNLSLIDLQEEAELGLDDEDSHEETDDIEEDVQEDFMMQELEDDEPFHDMDHIQEEECFEDLTATDSLHHSPAIEEKNDSYEQEHLQDGHGKENHSQTKPKPNDSDNRRFPIVKLPVLLAEADIDLDIFHSFDLEFPISSVTKIDWSVQCLEGRVLLPETTIFLKGFLVASMDYVSENSKQSLQMVKVQVPWKKTAKVEWLSSPLMPSKGREEYMFQCSGDMEPSFHREYHEQFAEHVQFELRSIRHVWNEELVSQAGKSKLHIQGSVSLSVDLLQPQYIALHSL